MRWSVGTFDPANLAAQRKIGDLMNAILKRLQQLADQDLFDLTEAIDQELQRREDMVDDMPESARRRAVERQQSYRRRTGSFAPPIKVVGLGKTKGPRRAA